MARLQRALRGPVLVRDHPAYEVARTTFNAMTDRHPAVIACCAGSDDVAAAVAWAQNEGLPAAMPCARSRACDAVKRPRFGCRMWTSCVKRSG
jgi:hypothetical protein